jgi:hypothetical protein
MSARPLHACLVCDHPTRTTSICRACTVAHYLYFARRDLERTGVLPRHRMTGVDLVTVYEGEPLVVERARALRAAI